MSWQQLGLPLLGIVLAILAQVAYMSNVLVEVLLTAQLVLMIVLVALGNRYLRQQILMVSDRVTQQHNTVMSAVYRMSREVVNISGLLYREENCGSEFRRTEKAVGKALDAMGSCAKLGGKLKSRSGRRRAGREVPYGGRRATALQGRSSTMKRSMAQSGLARDTDDYVRMVKTAVSNIQSCAPKMECTGQKGREGQDISESKMQYTGQQEAGLLRPVFIDTQGAAGVSLDRDEGSMLYVSGAVSKQEQEILGSKLDSGISVDESGKQETGASKKIFKKMCLNCANLMTKTGSPIRSNICQACKPIDGKMLTRYVYISKFNNLIEFYCGCEACVKFNGAGCKDSYCRLCTDPKFVRNSRNM